MNQDQRRYWRRHRLKLIRVNQGWAEASRLHPEWRSDGDRRTNSLIGVVALIEQALAADWSNTDLMAAIAQHLQKENENANL